MRENKTISKALQTLFFFFLFNTLLSAAEFDRVEMINQSSRCLDCHFDQEATLAASAHHIATDPDDAPPLAVGCTGCHDGWQGHMLDPSEDNIARLDQYPPDKQAEICARCHYSSHQAAMITTDPHAHAGISCLSCHRIHNNPHRAFPTDNPDDFCTGCHRGAKNDFALRSTHPLESENIACIDCHPTDATSDPLIREGFDWSCRNCHTELAGPFIFEHPAAENYPVGGGGCIECHRPHGSLHDRLLAQPIETLCRKCHGLPPGHLTAHDGRGAKYACIVCHSEVHGSNDNRLFLDRFLPDRFFSDCFQTGCHARGF